MTEPASAGRCGTATPRRLRSGSSRRTGSGCASWWRSSLPALRGGADRAFRPQSAGCFRGHGGRARSGRSTRSGVALNRTTPYLLGGSGVAFCFRAGIINIGAEGQIAVGGIGAAAVALAWPRGPPSWADRAAALIGRRAPARLGRASQRRSISGGACTRCSATLLLNFVALLLVQQALAGPLGQFGAGFLQSPLMPSRRMAAGSCRASTRIPDS